MSAGCNMGPVMFPGVQTYQPPMGTGMGVGVGMGTGVKMGPAMGAGGLGRLVLQYGPFLPCPPIAAPVPAQFGPRLLVPSFHAPTMAIADQSGVEAPGQRDPTSSNSVGMQGTNMFQTPRTDDPYYYFVGPHHLHGSSQIQMEPVCGGAMAQMLSCMTDEPGTSKRTDDADSNILG